MKITDMKTESKCSTIGWDILQQDANSSRNKKNTRLTNVSNEKNRTKNSILQEISDPMLENSQEIKNCFSTLVPGQYRKKMTKINEETKTGTESDSLSGKRAKKTYAKIRNQLTEKAHNFTSIYKKSALNIANFLSNYTSQSNKKHKLSK